MFKKLLLLCFFMVLFFSASTFAQKRINNERYYQNTTCPGKTEFRLNDGKRIDCLTDYYAIEYDFANKVYECTGQALYYASQTNKEPACVLIVERKKDCKYLKVINEINKINKPEITLFTVGLRCENDFKTKTK